MYILSTFRKKAIYISNTKAGTNRILKDAQKKRRRSHGHFSTGACAKRSNLGSPRVLWRFLRMQSFADSPGLLSSGVGFFITLDGTSVLSPKMLSIEKLVNLGPLVPLGWATSPTVAGCFSATIRRKHYVSFFSKIYKSTTSHFKRLTYIQPFLSLQFSLPQRAQLLSSVKQTSCTMT